MLHVAEPTAQQGQPAARFDALFERYYGQLYGLAYRLLGSRAEAEDVLQETFVRLAAAEAIQARPDAEVTAWLRRVCLNLGSNRLRDERRYSGYSYAEIADTLGIAIGSVGVLLGRAEHAFRQRYLEEIPA
jgi:DNA-directed RNA polymerase specialized sigma24 family protein